MNNNCMYHSITALNQTGRLLEYGRGHERICNSVEKKRIIIIIILPLLLSMVSHIPLGDLNA